MTFIIGARNLSKNLDMLLIFHGNIKMKIIFLNKKFKKVLQVTGLWERYAYLYLRKGLMINSSVAHLVSPPICQLEREEKIFFHKAHAKVFSTFF